MIFPKSVRHRHFHVLLKLQNPSSHLQNPLRKNHVLTSSIPYEFAHCHPFSWLSFSVAAHSKPQGSESPKEKCQESMKPLSFIFKEYMGMSEQTEISGIEFQCEGEKAELVGKLKTLEEEVKSLNNEKDEEEDALKLDLQKNGYSKPIPLWALFVDSGVQKERELTGQIDDLENHTRLSSDVRTFARHLYDEGYLKDAYFMPTNTFDLTLFENGYGRDFFKFAALKFGKNRHEIAKWLSARDLKELASFGCPCLERKTVFAAKTLRKFFEIKEHEVCKKCTIRKSCKHENQIFRKHVENLRLSGVISILIAYDGSSPQNLVLNEKIKNCVSRLLKEAISLSRTVS